MSRLFSGGVLPARGFPRVSGDEPKTSVKEVG